MRLLHVGDTDLEVDVRGSGEPVVLIQTALTADEFLPVARQSDIQDSYRVVLYYRRGYGRSSPVEGGGSMARDAEDCRNLLAVLDIERAHIVGVSYSAAVALQLAVNAPSVVHTLTVIEPPPVHVPNSEAFLAANEELMELYSTEGTSVALNNFFTRLMGPQWRDELESLLPGAVQQIERDAATFFTKDLPALLEWDFDAEAARRLDMPTLYIGGTESGPWFDAVHVLMADWLSPSQDVAIEGADHNLAVTYPGQVAQALINFISRYPMSA
jgi:pimeloyl-ACP methyl ester carboxylesterase